MKLFEAATAPSVPNLRPFDFHGPECPHSAFRVSNSISSNASSYNLRVSLFSVFGSGFHKQWQAGVRDVESSRLGGSTQINRTVTADDAFPGHSCNYNRRPLARLSKLGRAMFGQRKKDCLSAEEPGGVSATLLGPARSNSWHKTLPFRRDKQRPGAACTRNTTPTPENICALGNILVMDDELHTQDTEVSGGMAARAAAAAQNGIVGPNRQTTLKDLTLLRDLRLTSDSESGIGIELPDHSDDQSNLEISLVRRDPATSLPAEIFAHILLYLDARSLMEAELVSTRWHTTANSCPLWRNIFTSEYGRAQRQGSNIPAGQVGGPGFGLHRPNQSWKKMWKARKVLHDRWNGGRAAAVYLEGHQDTVYCVQFDEHKILTGSRDRTIRIWDTNTFECLKILGVPKQPVVGHPQIANAPPNRPNKGHQPIDVILPMASSHSLECSSLGDSPIHHQGSVLCLQFDDCLMVTGSSDTTLIMWDIKIDWKPKIRLRQHKAGVLDVCFNAEYIVSCSKDTTICLWDRSTGSLLRILAGHRGPVNAVQLRGELIVSASGDGVAKLWNVSSGLCVKEFPSRDRGLACVEFSPDCRHIFAGGNDQLIYQFNASNGELIRELKGHSHLVRSLHLDHLNGRIVSGSYDRSIKVYDIEKGEMICDFAGWTSSWMLSAKADYRRIVATSQDKRVVIIDFGHGLPDVELLRGPS